MNKSNKGFTLIELLATIAILAVVLSIVGYGVFNVIDSVREKSYKVTINNIQNEANNYVMEEFAKTKWVDSELYYNSEIQCVTVQNLIDSGYFKSDILDSSVSSNRNVLSTDNVLLVRDKDSKTVIMSKLLYEEDYAPLCDGFNTVGNIFFISDSKWSKNKDIDIKYNLYNEEYINLSDYRYDYMYEVSGTIIKDKISVFDYYEEKERINVNQNGILYANIKDTKGYVYASNHLIVNKIDNNSPYGNIDSTNDVNNKQTVTLNMSDNESGIVAYYFGTNNPEVDNVNWINIGNEKNYVVNTTVSNNGRYYLGVMDAVGNSSLVSRYFYRTILSVNNASVEPTSIITMEGNIITLPDAIPNAYYSFYGWYDNINYTGNVIKKYTPSSNSTLYGRVIENKLEGGIVKISGTAIYGNTLTADIIEDTKPKADKYTYQWYANSVNSLVGGSKISGATSKNLVLTADTFDKYIYVVVTATKENYRSISFSDVISSRVLRRNISVIANSNSKVYDGTALVDNGCSLYSGNMVFGDTFSCKMTSGSTITNIGSVNNVIESVNVSNGNSKYYNIIKMNGKLTITRKIVTLNDSCNNITYDGNVHELVSSKTGYSLSGNSGLDAGDYTVNAKLDSNYEWSDGSGTGDKSFVCSIKQATSVVNIKEQSLSLNYPNSGVFNYEYTGDGNLSCASTNSSVATCEVNQSTKQLKITSKGKGVSTITLTLSSGKNYKGSNDSASVSVGYKTVSLNSTCNNVTYDGQSHVLISAKTGYSLNFNSATDAGTYKMTATLNNDYYWSDTGTNESRNVTCSIKQATSVVNIKEPSLSLNYPNNGVFNYEYTGDGNLSCASTNTSVATCEINQGTKQLKITSKGKGVSTITLTLSSGKNYKGSSDSASVNISNIYMISYNSNGCGIAPSTKTIEYGDSVTISSMSASSDKIFNYWISDGIIYDVGEIYKFYKDTTLYANCSDVIKNNVYIKYNVNGGTVKSSTSAGSWSTNNGRILLNRTELTDEIAFGGKLDSSGLVNWDNTSHLYITKTGYHAKEGNEWICLSTNCSGKTYSDSTSYNASDFCDASNGDCTVELGVNWEGNLYTITYVLNGGYSQRANSYTNECSSSYSVGGNHDVWKIVNGQKSSVSSKITSQCRYGESCRLTSDVYERQCHIFKGWTTATNTYSKDYTGSSYWTGEREKDGFYVYADEFIYNTLGNITLYAVWKSDHNFRGIGNQLFVTSEGFTCDNYHTSHGGYGVYCTKCQMATAHYNRCYRPGYATGSMTMHCSCNPSYSSSAMYDDHAKFNSSGDKLEKIANTKLKAFGGIVENTSLNKSSGFVRVCNDHYAHDVTLDKQGGSGGTNKLYSSVGKGLYLNFDHGVDSDGDLTGTGKYSNQITSSNKITIPTKTGSTFAGYYTGTFGTGKQVINEKGYLASGFSTFDLQSGLTFSSYGSKQIITTRGLSYTSNVIIYAYWK